MASVEGKCKKCGIRYGYYSDVKSARHNVSTHTCKKGGKCEAEV
jgi:hypothetical protein